MKPEPTKIALHTKPLGVIGSLMAARRNVVEIVPKLATERPIISGKIARVRWHMIMDPSANRRVLLENLDNYPKSDVTKNILEPAIGQSLFNAEGAHWRWQRGAAAPVFTYRNIANLAPVMSRAAKASCKRLTKAPMRTDLFHEMVKVTYEVISSITFSGNDFSAAEEVHHAIDAYIESAGKISIMDVLGAPNWIPRPNRLFRPNTLQDMQKIADAAIRERQASGPNEPLDLLDLLLQGEDPKTKKRMNTGELRDNLLTFIVAGHETTALTLSWALYLLAFDQKIQNDVRDEVSAILKGDIADASHVGNMPLTEMVLKEALRLYPPAAFVSRTAQAHDVLCEREIRPKDTVMLPFYALHRNALLWDQPDAFLPERFDGKTEIDRYAYLPFGDGPRICIGMQFAMMEAKIVLSTLIDRFRFELIPGQADPKPVMILTLRPDGGVPLNVTPI